MVDIMTESYLLALCALLSDSNDTRRSTKSSRVAWPCTLPSCPSHSTGMRVSLPWIQAARGMLAAGCITALPCGSGVKSRTRSRPQPHTWLHTRGQRARHYVSMPFAPR